MLTLFRLAPACFLTFAFLSLGTSDTAQAQSLTVSTTSLTFSAAQGNNPSPPTQTFTTGTTGASINFNISTNQSWLLASTGAFGGSGGTSGQVVTVQINSTSLNAGTYSGTVTLTPTNGSAAVVVTITLTITGSGPATSTLSASLTQLNFAFELGHNGPPSQAILISSSGINLPITSITTNTAPTNNCPTGWLQASGGNSTPATLTVSIVTANLNPGACTGSVAVSSSTATNSTSVLIGVTLYISSSPLLNVAIPANLTSVTLQQGVHPVQFAIVLSSSDPNAQVAFTTSVAPGGDTQWLAVSPSSGLTPLGGTISLNVQVTPGGAGVGGLAAGSYTGSITIASTGLFNGSLTIPIAFTLTAATGVTVTPGGTQNFNESQLGSLPAPQTLTLTGSSSTTYTTTVTQQSGGLWLTATPTNGSITPSTPGSVTLTVLPNSLTPAVYSCLVTISFSNSAIPSVVIPVSLTVSSPATALLASPSSLGFVFQIGGNQPDPQTIAISNPGSGSLSYSVGSVTQSWISVTPSSGSVPGVISVSVAPQSLSPGTYTGSFTLSSSGAPSTIVTVTLTISANTAPQVFIIGNAASGVGGQLAPGEIITIKGSGLGPANPVSFTLGTLTAPTLAGVGVSFSGYPGTLLYVSSSQINVTVPYEIAGTGSTNVVVSYGGASSGAITQPVGSSSLGLFTNSGNGTGQAAILNQDYSRNGVPTAALPASPAAQGSYISVYATGGGQTVPASTDGEVSPNSPLLPLILANTVVATIGGKSASVVFAGAAPGNVTGLVQFNIQVPTGVSGTALPIVVTINGVPSQSGATVAVQ